MSKAILVIDIPNEWLEYEDEKIEDLMVSYTLYSHKTIYDEAYSKPLKELPQFKKPKDPDETWDEMHIRAGYNACLEELLGGNDEF